MIRSTIVIDFPPFGPVVITPRANARCIRLRSTPKGWAASVPAGADRATVSNAIRQMLPRLKEKVDSKPAFVYSEGQTFTFPEGRIAITRSSRNPEKISCSWRNPEIVIGVGESLYFSDRQVTFTISNLLKRMACRMAPAIIIPQARLTAKRTGVSPDSWAISHGTRTFGTCFPSERRINLSGILLFLPVHLRDYIICHELAHLTHADHSPEFHKLCNHYCSGQERLLELELRSFVWPILR